MRDQVFISYSHRDKRWLEKLQVMLEPLTQKRTISVWDDAKISAGGNWKEQIEGALAVAKVAVLLVSPYFLASKFIAEYELPPLLQAAKEQGLTILWVYLSCSLYDETEIGKYQAAHDIARPLDTLRAAEQGRVLVNICRKIKEAATQIVPNVHPPTAAYPHPPSGCMGQPGDWPPSSPIVDWQPADCETVRDAFTRLLTRGARHGVVLIRGASGTGKSHLTRYLFEIARSCGWLACGRFDLKSGADLEAEFVRFVLHLGVEEAIRAVAGEPLRVRLDAILSALRTRAKPTLLLFDTFEQGGEWTHWVEQNVLLATPGTEWLRVLVAGQYVPDPAGTAWESRAAPAIQLQPLGWEPLVSIQ